MNILSSGDWQGMRHKVLFVISQPDKAEPTSGGEKLSTEQKQNISRKSSSCMSCSNLKPCLCGVGTFAVGTAGDG
jgi:predicted GTPase